MQRRTFTYKSSDISYLKAGNGPRLTVCFHGFLEEASSFQAMADHLPDHTLIAFDLPFHGQTQWREGLRLGVQQWVDIIAACPDIGQRDYGLMGYSMGGKMALTVYENRPDRVPFLYLIAPDGLRPDPWHRFATRTRIGHALMRFTLNHPTGFIKLLDILERTRLLNGSIAKFVRYYMQDAGMRQKVYHTWMTFRDFRPSTEHIRTSVERCNTDMAMVFGRYDRLCPAHWGRTFTAGLAAPVRLRVLPAGHLLLREHHLPSVAAALTAKTAEPAIPDA